MTFEEIKRKRNHFTFVWAITHILQVGTERCQKYTDKEIKIFYLEEVERQEKAKSICWYTPEVVRDMYITARELANLEPTEFINGIVRADLWNAHPISWDRMNEIASQCVDGLIIDGMYEAKEYFRDVIDMSEEEAEYFGITDLYDDEEE